MSISVDKKYKWGSDREIEIDNIIIKLTGSETEELFEKLDEDLNFGDTREDLLKKIESLEKDIEELKEVIREVVTT